MRWETADVSVEFRYSNGIPTSLLDCLDVNTSREDIKDREFHLAPGKGRSELGRGSCQLLRLLGSMVLSLHWWLPNKVSHWSLLLPADWVHPMSVLHLGVVSEMLFLLGVCLVPYKKEPMGYQ